MKIQKISDIEWVCTLQTNTQVILKLEEDIDLVKINFFDSNQIQYTDAEFVFKDENESGDSYLLARMYVPDIHKRCGLGTAAVKMFLNYSKATIYVRDHDGIVRDDQSHLTEDGPAFASALKVRKLIK